MPNSFASLCLKSFDEIDELKSYFQALESDLIVDNDLRNLDKLKKALNLFNNFQISWAFDIKERIENKNIISEQSKTEITKILSASVTIFNEIFDDYSETDEFKEFFNDKMNNIFQSFLKYCDDNFQTINFALKEFKDLEQRIIIITANMIY